MKHLNLYEENDFSEKVFKKLLVHDSPYFKIINFNFKAGQELPVHNHDIEGQLSLVIIEGEGEFLGKDNATIPAKAGDVVISEIAEPHGLRAKTGSARQNRPAAVGNYRSSHIEAISKMHLTSNCCVLRWKYA
jgi:quercetin dioxygenase-like cupin family protein